MKKSLLNSGGDDIAVYFVNDSRLSEPGVLQRGKLYPACLPARLHKNQRGILAGWNDPSNLGNYYSERPEFVENNFQPNFTVDTYRERETILKHIRLDNTSCKDPQWMNSNSFYPEGINTLVPS